jgi:hypothetical protein
MVRIAPSVLRCTSRTGALPGRVEFEVPGATLEVVDVPRAGRPDGFSGAIGPVTAQAIATPQRVSLGQTVRLALMVRGPGDLWNLADPLPEIATAEIFRRRPEVTVEMGPVLSIVRHFAYDVVPRQEGELVFPGIRIPYFDPIQQQFAVETIAPIRITVSGRNAPAPPGDLARKPPAFEGPGVDSIAEAIPETADARWAAVAAAALCVGVGGWVWRLARRSRGRSANLRASLERELDSATDPSAIARILRAAIGSRVPGIGSMSAEEIIALPNIPEVVRNAARVLTKVERARFDPNSSIPEREEIRRALDPL